MKITKCNWDCEAACPNEKHLCPYCKGETPWCSRCHWTGNAWGHGLLARKRPMTRAAMKEIALIVHDFSLGQFTGVWEASNVAREHGVKEEDIGELEEFNLRSMWIEHILHLDPYSAEAVRIEASILMSEVCR